MKVWCLSAFILSFVRGGVWVLYIGIGMPVDWVLFRPGYGGEYVSPTTVCQCGICVQELHVICDAEIGLRVIGCRYSLFSKL